MSECHSPATPPLEATPNKCAYSLATLLVRRDGMVTEISPGEKIAMCNIPVAEIAVATNQVLSISGDNIALSGAPGSTIPLPGLSQLETLPPVIDPSAPIPSASVGGVTYLLGDPAIWLQVVVGGVTYAVPGYAVP